MAGYGQHFRGRPVLYKPTDFGREQSRSQTNVLGETKTDEKVIKRIQKRLASCEEEKSVKCESRNTNSTQKRQEKVTATTKGSSDEDSSCTQVQNGRSNSTKWEDKTPNGVSDKDLGKIKQLQQFMAKQQMSGRENGKVDKEDKGCNNSVGRNNVISSRDNKDSKQSLKSKRQNLNSKTAQRANKQDRQIDSEKYRTKSSNKKNKDKVVTKTVKETNSDVSSESAREKRNIQKFNNSQQNYDRKGFGRTHPHTVFSPLEVDFPNDLTFLQMQYAAAGPSSREDKQSILGNPHNHITDYKKTKRDKAKNQESGVIKSLSPPNKICSPEKSERQKSLDFVKNFFDTDPEVQYNRKQNAEKRAVAARPSTPVEQISPQVNVSSNKTAGLNMQSKSNPTVINTMSQHTANINQQVIKLQSTNTRPLLQNHIQQYESNISLPYSPTYHASTYHVTDIPNVNSLQLNDHASAPAAQQSFHQSQSALQQGMPQASLHHNVIASGNTLYTGVTHNQTPLHHQHQQQQGASYQDMFSQMNVPSTLSSGSNAYRVLQQQNAISNTMNSTPGNGFSMYSGYFPQGNHQHSHVQHVEQHIDSNIMTKIFQNQSKSIAWQETVLSKCGPIDSSQARSLIEQLINGTYECMVCCETVKWNSAVWSCSSCFHIFHLNCIRKWARSEAAAVKDESGWRCPGCQNVSTRPPNKYYCFCGKVRDPDWNPSDGLTPHSCGEVCKKKRISPFCDHGCNELCHPGPCPPCPVMVSKHCPCGKTSTKMRCGTVKPITCDSDCKKVLNCLQHRCEEKCHGGACRDCTVKHNEECYCSKERRVIKCGTGEVLLDEQPENVQFKKKYSCQQLCENLLSCGSHFCKEMCHIGECKECSLLPKQLLYCPCGKRQIKSLLNQGEGRQLCTDPIPTCDSFCGKKLNCGPKGSSHLCMMKCHNGACQPCDKVTIVQCRCGATRKELPCKDLKAGEGILCEKKCSKKRKCGRHKCNQKCCTDLDHNCNVICGKKLSCGAHRCEEVCHTGFCPPCWRASFDELACRCGSTVLYPPVACGAKPPECDKPCNRAHSCGHQPLHTCHNEESCPPCTVLTTKQCMGRHEIWKNVPCHLTEVSCGHKCGKILKCRMHSCTKICHKGACLDEQDKCTQPCPVKRTDCSHPCGEPCHAGSDCPLTSCKAQVLLKCRCDRKSANTMCLAGNLNSVYQSFSSEMLSSQLHNLQTGQSIDLSRLVNSDKRPKFLDCDEECARLERNKRLAEALGIENAEEGRFQPTFYSSSLRQDAKSQFRFVKMVEDVLEHVITTAKKSAHGHAQHSLPPMNTAQRRLIHELAEVYNCKTYSLDQEPKRNAVIIASKDSFVPSVKLSVLTEREIMKPIPPPPIVLNQDNNPLILGSPNSMKPIPKYPNQNGATPKVNYFDDDFLE